MAIPTQFSVTNKRSAPLANPDQPIDNANPLTAEIIGFISGASVLPVKSTSEIVTPSELSALGVATINNPASLSAKPVEDIDSASLFSALSNATIDNPFIIDAESVTPVDSAIELTAKPVSEVDAPNLTIVDRIQWDFNSSLLGWSAVNATLTPNATTMTAVMTGTDFQLIKDGLAAGPRSEYLLLIRARCTTATLNTRVSAFTKNSKHGYSNSFRVQSELTEMPQGAYVEFYLNLGEIQDYFVEGLTSLRIDLYEGDLETFEVDSIWFGRYQTDFIARSEAEVDAPTTLVAESESSISLPSAASAESAPSIATPSALTANSGTPSSGPFPLNHARILYNNKLFGYETVTSVKGVPINALTPNTWQRWIFDSSTTSSGIRIDLPSAVTMDCICIGAHNLGAIGATVSITYSTDGSTFVDWAPDFDVGGRAAIMSYTQTPKQVKAIQIFIQAGTTATGYIGYISAGEALQMQRPFFNGHQPYTDADVTEYYSNRTESGNIIGRQIRSRGYETTYEWQNIDDTWYRNNIPVFKDYAKRWPMFIAWNLLEYPEDVAFGETTGDIAASMQNGTRTKRTGLSFTLKGV